MGPVNGFFSIGGGGVCGANPFDLMELIRRTPQVLLHLPDYVPSVSPGRSYLHRARSTHPRRYRG